MNPALRRALCLLLLVLAPSAGARAERLPIRKYTTADGLAHNSINRIVRDSRGFLWFCTAEGLSRFDGQTFVSFGVQQGLPHPSVRDILETRSGEYWIATEGGLARFHPRGTPMFATVAPNDDRGGHLTTVLLEARDGTIWAGTNDGLFRLERTGADWALRMVDVGLPNEYAEQRIIADLLEVPDGTLWIAAASGLYRRWPDGSAARYTHRERLPHYYMSDLFRDRSGRMWAATRLEGFFSFAAGAGREPPSVGLKFTYRLDDLRGLRSSWVSQIFESSDRAFYLATPRGLVEFFEGKGNGERFRFYTARDGLTDPTITSINEDNAGNVWLGTPSGAIKLTRGGFSTYGQADGIETVNDIFEDGAGELCLRAVVLGDPRTSVFEGGKLDLIAGDQARLHTRVGCFDGSRFRFFTPNGVSDLGWVGEQVTLQTRAGEWWLATGTGLLRFPAAPRLDSVRTLRPLARYTVADGLAGHQAFRLFEDADANVWISSTAPSTAGLARWDRGSNRLNDQLTAPGLARLKADWAARSFAQDVSGAVWIGFDGELARYASGRFTLFTAQEGVPPGKIRDLHVDASGRLWFASSISGLVRVESLAADRPAFTNYTVAQGLASNNTEVITEDGAGRIYVGGVGVSRLDPATGHIENYTAADGLPGGIYRAAFRDRHGTLWFGLTDGLARLRQVPEHPEPASPAWVSGFRVRGVAQRLSALGEQTLALPDFDPYQNQVQIDFTGLSFSSGQVLRFQYRLEQTDSDWSPPSDQRSVTYASLPPGRHRFLVRAVNADGLVSAEPARVDFTILRPLWQRSWFLTVIAVAAALAAYSLYRYRVARLLELANMRTRIATDLHDDIGANLTRIALLSDAAARSRSEDGPLVAIARIARESVSSMSDIVWAVNPKRETLVDLVRRMRQHADEIFTQRGIEMQFRAPAVESRRLGMNLRRDLLLVFKEAVNNAARHSGCSMVRIDLSIHGRRLVLTVDDNGVGFDTTREGEGQGMTSFRRRAAALGGTIAVESSAAGTTVRADVPL